MKFTLLTASTLIMLAAASPVELNRRSAFDSNVPVGDITEGQLAIAAPGIKSSCSSTQTNECSDKAKTAKGLNDVLSQYKLTTLGQKAAIVALTSLESVDFQFNTNQSPGRVGQGTKAMLMFNFIYDYAYSQEELREDTVRLGGGKKLSLTFDTIGTVPDDQQKAIRAQVLPDKYTFGAAPWFLTTVCTKDVQGGLSKSGWQGFQQYMESCVSTGPLTMDSDRGKKWCLAMKALKPADMDMPAGCPN